MNFDQTLQRHGRGIELLTNIKILVTFDLHSRSRDPRWPPNTFFKVKFGPKTTHNSANFWSNSIIFVWFVAGDQFSTLDGKAIPTMVPCVFWLQRNDPPILLFTTMENCIVLTGSRHFQLRMMGKLIQTVIVPPLISLQ